MESTSTVHISLICQLNLLLGCEPRAQRQNPSIPIEQSKRDVLKTVFFYIFTISLVSLRNVKLVQLRLHIRVNS
jgi:hypothetical protein